MIDKCPDIIDLENTLLLPEDHSLRKHVESCGQCQARLQSLMAFDHDGPLTGDEDVPGLQAENIARVEGNLDEFLTKKIGSRKPGGSVLFPRNKHRVKSFTWMGMAAVLVAVMGIWAVPAMYDSGTKTEVLRGVEVLHSTKLEMISANRDSEGGLVLEWQAIAGAATYEVVFWNDALEEYLRLEPVAEPIIVIAAVLLPDPQKAIYFNILALNGDKEITRSSLTEIPAR